MRISGEKEIKLGNEMIDSEGVTVSENTEIQAFKRRFSFSKINVPIGAEIVFIRDKSKIARVIDDTTIEYNGTIHTLTSLADNLMKDLGYEWKSIQGPRYFEYKGKPLLQLKAEIEEIE